MASVVKHLCNVLGSVAAAVALLTAPAVAQEQDSGAARGVNPKDNITKTEVIAKVDAFDGDTLISTVAFKFDYAFDSSWGVNVEVPVIRYDGFGGVTAGLGDVALRGRNVQNFGRLSVISAVELVSPTATDDVLGTGKFQLNPVIGGVYAFDELNFGFLGYKHYFSVAGDDGRADINRSEFRGLLAFLSTAGSWTLADVKYARSLTGTRREILDLELEYGQMLSDDIGLSGRIGTSFLDSDRKFGVTLNLRKIW